MIEISSRPGVSAPRPPRKPGEKPVDTAVPPMKIFDDVYYIGRNGVGVFAVTTQKGIVLVDAMDPCDAAEQYIVPGLKEVGLNVEDINTVIVTHGHYDHFAGAKHLQDSFGAKIAQSYTDTAWMMCSETRNRPGIEFPKTDIILEDRKALEFGDHTFIPVLTPGHTPGGMSLIFNVHDRGEEHWVSLWVGGGLPIPVQGTDPVLSGLELQVDLTCKYIRSLYTFEEACRQYECDVVLGVHPHRCGLFAKYEKLKERREGEANAFVVGREGVNENLKGLSDKAIEHLQMLMDATFKPVE